MMMCVFGVEGSVCLGCCWGPEGQLFMLHKSFKSISAFRKTGHREAQRYYSVVAKTLETGLAGLQSDLVQPQYCSQDLA